MAFPADHTLLAEWVLPSITGFHSNLPVPLKYADFTANALTNIDDGGGDLRFSSDAAGLQQLPCQVYRFDKASTNAQVWIKVPFAFTGAVVYVWGNNPGETQPLPTDLFGSQAVWSDYEFVTHEGVTDATGNYPITQFGSPLAVTDLFGNPTGAVDVNGSNQWGRAAVSYVRSRPMTYQVWASTDNLTGTDRGIFGSYSSSEGFRFDAVRLKNTNAWSFWDRVMSGTDVESSATVSTAQWFKITSIGDSSSSRSIIVDGSTKNTDTTTNGSFTATMNRLSYGRFDDSTAGGYFNGQISQMRLKFDTQSDDRELTEYQSQSSLTWGVMTDVVSGGVIADLFVVSKKPTVSIIASATTPAITAEIDVTSKKPLVSIVGSVTLPNPIADIAVLSKKPVVSINASASIPNPAADIQVTAKKPIVEIFASVIDTGVDADISVIAKKPTVAISGSVTLPNPIADINVTSKKPVVLISATVSGLIILPPDDAKLTYEPGSNYLEYDPGSNKLAL